MNSGLWISWYNLPSEGRDDYLSWLNSTYIPKILARPGVMSAAHFASESAPSQQRAGNVSATTDPSVPTGDRYILIVEGKTAHAFAAPMPSRYHSTLPPQDRRMLALRIGERSNVMTVEAEVFGPNAKPGNNLPLSPGIQLGSFNSRSYQNEDELADWFALWRLRCMEKLPGCVRARKLVSISGWAKHAILFEFTSVEARNSNFPDHEKDHPEMAQWSTSVIQKLLHAPGSPNVARRIWPTAK